MKALANDMPANSRAMSAVVPHDTHVLRRGKEEGGRRYRGIKRAQVISLDGPQLGEMRSTIFGSPLPTEHATDMEAKA